MKTLYMFYLGGSAPGANIELHDIQFVAAENTDASLPVLKDAWFGDKHHVHLDGYAKVTWVAGYDVLIADTPSLSNDKLWFVNVGGYVPHTLAEQHEFGLFVASHAEGAKKQAKARFLTDAFKQHKDDLIDVQRCLLHAHDGPAYIHLRANPHGQPVQPCWQGYQPL